MNMKKLMAALASSAIVAGAAWAALASANDASPQVQASVDKQLIERGRYLSLAGDCVACHTAPGGKPFAGGLGINSPVGVIYTSNITPDKETGIGAWTYEDFDRAVRQGIAKDGTTLYPAMPYPSYSKVRSEDVKALYAYFMQGVEPVAQANKGTDIPWPLSMRWPLRFWRMAFAPEVAFDTAAAADQADPVKRGRYLVEGFAHCGSCHTPRGIGMQLKALSDDNPLYLSGGVVDGYLAKNLRGDAKDGLGTWSEADIVAFLRSGRNGHSAAFGPMTEAVSKSMQHLNDADLVAIARYLKSLKPAREGGAPLVADDAAALMLRTGADRSNGALTFVDNCAACHRTTGSGYDSTFPKLALSTTVNTADPSSLIALVLKGGEMPSTTSAPTHFAMPGFAARLTDRDIADVLTFVRSSWGNSAPAVTADEVAKARKSLRAAPPPSRPENG
jgi:alcohol dehydrogenase (quinone), cytochrome c subunit